MSDKKYLILNSLAGYRAGEAICYECIICGGTLKSMPEHSVACKCRNIIIDVDAGRIAVKDSSKFRAYTS